MHRLAESKLLAGFIYGDPHMQEYIYLPASELDAASPMLVYETGKERHFPYRHSERSRGISTALR